MLMIEPPPKKTHFTFFTPSYHRQLYPNNELEEIDPSSWKAQLATYSYPHKEEEIDHIFPWRFDHEKFILYAEFERLFRLRHSFRDAPILYQRAQKPLLLTWKS